MASNTQKLISDCCKKTAVHFKTEDKEGYRCQECRLICKIVEVKEEKKPESTKKSEKEPKKEKEEKKRMTGKKDEIAYTFKDKGIGSMDVLNTANAWWLDPIKVELFIAACKKNATDEQACGYAGITRGQLEYFMKLHPDFLGIKALAKQFPVLLAKERIVNQIPKNTELAKWYLEKHEKATYGDSIDVTSGGEKIEGNVIQFRDFSKPKEDKSE